MKLKVNHYELLEYVEDCEDDEYSLVIGNILKTKSEFMHAEIVGHYITDINDLMQVQAFIDIVKREMVWTETNRLTAGYTIPDHLSYTIKSNTPLVTESDGNDDRNL